MYRGLLGLYFLLNIRLAISGKVGTTTLRALVLQARHAFAVHRVHARDSRISSRPDYGLPGMYTA
jgi:hypothetical protein